MTVWINSPFDTLPGEGGRPMRYWMLCRALVAAGHSVVLWSSDFHHVTKRRRPVAAMYETEGFQVRLVPTLAYGSNVCWRRWASHRQYARAWGKLAYEAVDGQALEKPDCILVSLPPLGLYAEAEQMRRLWGSRVIVDIQDAWPETFYRLLPRGMRWLAAGVFWRARVLACRAYRGADGVSAVSERYVRLARDYGCRSPTGVFPLGCLLSQKAATGRMGVTDEKALAALRLCYVGNLGEAYDIRTMIDGIRMLTAEGCGVTLKVAGDGPQRGRVSEAIEKGMPVCYCGYLQQEALQACLAECDVGIVPMFTSSWVAVPNKVADYAAAGLAMINGLKGETQELLERYEAGLLYETGDVLSFVSVVRRYSEDRALLARHRHGALRLADTRLDAGRIYPEMARGMEKVVG